MSDIFDEIKNKGEGDIFDTIPEGGSRPTSTVTGRQVPTAEEAWAQGRKVAGATAPIAGDILGSILAPQLKGPQLGVKGINILSRMAGAGAGGLGGSVAGQKIEKGDVDWNQALVEGALGGASEGAFGVLGLVKKPVMKLASNLTVSGSKIKNYLQNSLIDKTTKRAEKFIIDIAPDAVKGQKVAMDDIGLMVNSALDANKIVYKQYSESLNKAAEQLGGRVPLGDTGKYIDVIREKANRNVSMGRKKSQALFDNRTVREFGYTPNSPEGLILKDLMETGSTTPQNVEYLLARVLKSWEKDSPAIRSNKETLKKALLGDLDKIANDAGESVADIKRAADETFKSVKRFNDVKKLYSQAISVNQATGETTVQAHRLAKLIYGAEGKIKRDMPDMWPKLKAEADYYAGIAEKLKDMKPGGVPEAVKGLPYVSGSALFLGGPKAAAVAEGIGAVSAWALMGESDRLLLKVLAEGFAKPATKAGLHLGAREVAFE